MAEAAVGRLREPGVRVDDGSGSPARGFQQVDVAAVSVVVLAAVLVMALGAFGRCDPGYPGFSLNARDFRNR